VLRHTPFVQLLVLLIVLWMGFSAGMFWMEHGVPGAAIQNYGDALYWGIAAFSTAGIADTPVTGTAKFIGGVWIVVGSLLFFGTIVATVTGYFMRPMQRPHRQIIDTIEYNLENLEDLEIDELDLLKDTIDALILHMESVKSHHETKASA
jgi:voltage-gated potassium channel